MKVITIGRSTDNNDVVVNDEKVSRNHLQMVMDDNGNYAVVDLGSTNGTYVNGQRISGEVRLQPSDEVRIGQTILPWQNYFVTSSQSPTVNPPLLPQPHKPKTWLYIVIGAALLLMIGGGVAWKIYHDKQKEKIEQEEKDKEYQEQQLEQKASDARVEAARLSEEAEKAAKEAAEAAKIAAETKSEKDKAFAEEMRIKAEEANRLAQQKEAEWKKMKSDLDEANKAKEAAVQQSKEAAKAKDNAEKDAAAAKTEAAQAKKAKEEAEKAAQQTKEFYILVSEIPYVSGDFKEICDELGYKRGLFDDNKDILLEKFDKANNTERQRIINAIKKVRGKQTKKEKDAKEQEGTDDDGNKGDSQQPVSSNVETLGQ